MFSGSLFTAAFIWMAITAYDVDEQEIKVFLVMSFLVLGVLIAAGSLFALVLFGLRKLRKSDDGLLAKIETIEKETQKTAPKDSSAAADQSAGAGKEA